MWIIRARAAVFHATVFHAAVFHATVAVFHATVFHATVPVALHVLDSSHLRTRARYVRLCGSNRTPSPARRYTIHFTRNANNKVTSRLVIERVDSSDFGSWTCTAAGPKEVSTTIELNG